MLGQEPERDARFVSKRATEPFAGTAARREADAG
jgi:hypothetical protein